MAGAMVQPVGQGNGLTPLVRFLALQMTVVDKESDIK